MAEILVVGREGSSRNLIEKFMNSLEHVVTFTDTGRKAINVVKKSRIDLVAVDLDRLSTDPVEFIARMREVSPQTLVVPYSRKSDLSFVVDCMRAGAADYILKPVLDRDLARVAERLEEALKSRGQRSKTHVQQRFKNLVGESSAMKRIYRIIEQIADSTATTLITGESGTGKELIADAVHNASRRRDYPFIKVNCAALPESLLESELFGHEKGAFTGAVRAKPGRFELAQKGTIFLDEIGDIAPSIQVKLLRVLQEGEFERVGGTRTIRVDVRVIAATNRDIARMVEMGQFREDLYYRLNVIGIQVPALREHKEDIPLLVEHFLKKYSRAGAHRVHSVSSKCMKHLMKYDWPGNIRELENTIERAVLLADGPQLEVRHLPEKLQREGRFSSYVNIELGSSLEAAEKMLILSTLNYAGGNRRRAAEILKVSLRTLQYKLKQYGVSGFRGRK